MSGLTLQLVCNPWVIRLLFSFVKTGFEWAHAVAVAFALVGSFLAVVTLGCVALLAG